MEVIGTASNVAGLLFLGIEVCKGLLKYYQTWKFAEDDVARTYVSIETLGKSLILIKEVLDNKSSSTSLVTNPESCIWTVNQTVSKLSKKLDKIKVTPKHGWWRERSKSQFSRTLYPFKESTLAKLKELSQEAKDDLSLALNTLHM